MNIGTLLTRHALSVSDGSQFTTGGAENPTLTIVTLAVRQADYIADQMAQGLGQPRHAYLSLDTYECPNRH